MDEEEQIRAYYYTLFQVWGPQHWWPARSRFEVIVGAYLTQNTSWTNVERALRRLRSAGLLNLRAMREVSLAKLESQIRSAGYFRQKAQRLKTFVAFLDDNYGGSLTRMFAQPTAKLRAELLALNGVGPETADAILLYAGGHPVFVVDAYTRRTLARHRLIGAAAGHEEIRSLAERALAGADIGELNGSLSLSAHKPSRMSRAARSVAANNYNEMHGLLVMVGKLHCHKRVPHCEGCPLQPF